MKYQLLKVGNLEFMIWDRVDLAVELVRFVQIGLVLEFKFLFLKNFKLSKKKLLGVYKRYGGDTVKEKRNKKKN